MKVNSKPQSRELPEKIKERLIELRQKHVSPNKPIMFAVIHEPENVEKAMDEFRETIKGKKFLYIEMFPEDWEKFLSGKWVDNTYSKLALEAHNSGLTVVPLDSEKYREDEKKLGKKISVKERERRITQMDSDYAELIKTTYLNREKREKRWVGISEGAKSDSVIVMHPNHAVKVSKQLQLPERNTIMLDKPIEPGLDRHLYLGVREHDLWKTRFHRKRDNAIRRMHQPIRV